MIAEGKNIRVVEKATGKDITKYVLMQVLLEERYEIMPEFFLKILIQSPAKILEQFFQGYFPYMFEYFLKMRENQMMNMQFPNMMFGQQQQQQFPFGGFNMQQMPGMPNMNAMTNPTAMMEEIIKRLADLEKKIK
jgi:polyhydroxyalkanoate synthesis regulator protein